MREVGQIHTPQNVNALLVRTKGMLCRHRKTEMLDLWKTRLKCGHNGMWLVGTSCICNATKVNLMLKKLSSFLALGYL